MKFLNSLFKKKEDAQEKQCDHPYRSPSRRDEYLLRECSWCKKSKSDVGMSIGRGYTMCVDCKDNVQKNLDLWIKGREILLQRKG